MEDHLKILERLVTKKTFYAAELDKKYKVLTYFAGIISLCVLSYVWAFPYTGWLSIVLLVVFAVVSFRIAIVSEVFLGKYFSVAKSDPYEDVKYGGEDFEKDFEIFKKNLKLDDLGKVYEKIFNDNLPTHSNFDKTNLSLEDIFSKEDIETKFKDKQYILEENIKFKSLFTSDLEEELPIQKELEILIKNNDNKLFRPYDGIDNLQDQQILIDAIASNKFIFISKPKLEKILVENLKDKIEDLDLMLSYCSIHNSIKFIGADFFSNIIDKMINNILSLELDSNNHLEVLQKMISSEKEAKRLLLRMKKEENLDHTINKNKYTPMIKKQLISKYKQAELVNIEVFQELVEFADTQEAGKLINDLLSVFVAELSKNIDKEQISKMFTIGENCKNDHLEDVFVFYFLKILENSSIELDSDTLKKWISTFGINPEILEILFVDSRFDNFDKTYLFDWVGEDSAKYEKYIAPLYHRNSFDITVSTQLCALKSTLASYPNTFMTNCVFNDPRLQDQNISNELNNYIDISWDNIKILSLLTQNSEAKKLISQQCGNDTIRNILSRISTLETEAELKRKAQEQAEYARQTAQAAQAQAHYARQAAVDAATSRQNSENALRTANQAKRDANRRPSQLQSDIDSLTSLR